MDHVYIASYYDDDCHSVDRYFRDKKMATKQLEVWRDEQKNGESNIFHVSDEPRQMVFSDNDIYNKYFRPYQKN